MIRHFDRERLRRDFQIAKPFPSIVIEDFLEPAAVEQLVRCYPTFETATKLGFSFNAVNEQKKVQVTDSSRFPEPVRRLNEAISSPAFLEDLAYITGIPKLLSDELLTGGGMHITGPGGRLDVHVDFNYFEDRKLHRRLNLLLYLNPVWEDAWGGQIELWDKEVKNCLQSYTPRLNRCLIFQTSEISYHGVVPITCPAGVERKSFAAYYYTREAPSEWTGEVHSTLFRARPDEKLRGYLLMPAERLGREAISRLRGVKRRVKNMLVGPG